MIVELIKNILNLNFNCNKIEIYNESHHHKNVHSQHSHFKIIIVSNNFKKISLLNRHKNIYFLLSEYISKYKIKALSLHTYTTQEWKKIQNKQLLKSPRCNYRTFNLNKKTFYNN